MATIDRQKEKFMSFNGTGVGNVISGKACIEEQATEPPRPHPDSYSAGELAHTASETIEGAKNRLAFITKRRDMLEQEYNEACMRLQSEAETLHRLIRGLESALGLDQMQTVKQEANAPIPGTLLRNA